MLQVHLTVTAKQTRFKGFLRVCAGWRLGKSPLALLQTRLECVDGKILIGCSGKYQSNERLLWPEGSNISHEGKALAGVTGKVEDSSTQIVLVMGG